MDKRPIEINGRSGLLFVGNFNHPPNIDALLYFVEIILPIVKRTLPDIALNIVGNNPPKEILSLERKEIIVAGHVPSTEPYLRKARVSVAPLRYGAGMKGKIGEAMAHGLPVVTTSIGAEGMGLVSGETAFISDSPQEFAEYIITLCTDNSKWQSMASAARLLILDNYSPQKASLRLVEILRQAESLRPLKSPASNEFSSPASIAPSRKSSSPSSSSRSTKSTIRRHALKASENTRLNRMRLFLSTTAQAMEQ
ncbi:MAG: glycosyltransferase family 4 protein [Desulfobacterales bacterium]|nr:glycosyltransferase family 4 protein [Desulfobacterales bacterium]